MEYIYAEDVLCFKCKARLGKNNEDMKQLELQVSINDLQHLLQQLLPLARNVKSTRRAPLLLQLIEQQIEHYALRVGTDRSASSLCKYRTTLKHLRAYVSTHYATPDVPWAKVNADFMNGFTTYLQHIKELAPQTTRLYLSAMRHFCHQAMCKGWLVDASWQTAEMPPAPRCHFALTKAEVLAIAQLKLGGTADSVRNLFLFATQTGLAYADLKALRPQHIERDETGGWLTISRTKTGQRALIHLSLATLTLLSQLPKHETLAAGWLMVPDNCTMNRHLRTIGVLVGLTKKLHLHVARHTFATLLLQSGISVETVSTMLGHARIATTQHYAEVTKQKILRELREKENG